MSKLEQDILNKVNKNNYGAFTSSDFLELAKYKNISKSLELMEDSKKICRINRGIYYIPLYDDKLNMYSSVDINEVAKALARQFNWNIVPSGNYALNILGISTQVPSKYVYISDGPYRTYIIGKNELIFKHATGKEINGLPFHILITIQALKTIGKDNLSLIEENKIKKFLEDKDLSLLKNNSYKITSWIYEKLLKIMEE